MWKLGSWNGYIAQRLEAWHLAVTSFNQHATNTGKVKLYIPLCFQPEGGLFSGDTRFYGERKGTRTFIHTGVEHKQYCYKQRRVKTEVRRAGGPHMDSHALRMCADTQHLHVAVWAEDDGRPPPVPADSAGLHSPTPEAPSMASKRRATARVAPLRRVFEKPTRREERKPRRFKENRQTKLR